MAAPLLRRNSRDPGIFPSVLRPLVDASSFSQVGCSDPSANQSRPISFAVIHLIAAFRARTSRRELAQVLVSRPCSECPGSGDFSPSDKSVSPELCNCCPITVGNDPGGIVSSGPELRGDRFTGQSYRKGG